MTRRTLSMAALGVAAVLFVAVNVLAQATLRQARLDLTADRLFTLSQGTRNILATLKEPITLRLYFSERLAAAAPQFRTYGQRVRELLEEYANRSHGMIRLQVIDPEPFSDTEDKAVQAGLQGVPIDATSGQATYFGLIGTNSTDHREVVPFFNQEREAFLEYDLTKLVYALTDPKKPVVGVLSDMDLTYGPGGMMAAMRGEVKPYAFVQQLRQNFDVRVLKTDIGAIDKDVTVLLLVRPQKLTDAALYAVDQYILGGGKAMVFVDPYAESVVDQPGPGGMPAPGADKSAALPRLFKAWGIEMTAGKFVADPALAVRVSAGEPGRRRAIPYAAWLSVAREQLNRTDVVTADLATLTLASAGALAAAKDATTTLVPLITSSPLARLLDTTRLDGQPEPEALLSGLGEGGSAMVLAARVTGPVKTAFPDGPPKAADSGKDGGKKAEEKKPDAAPLTASTQPVNLIVIADTDMLEDRFWMQEQNFLGQRLTVPFSNNVDFLINGVDNLTGSGDLIGLRGRAGAARPFTVVENLHRAAGERSLAREQELRKKLTDIQRQISELETKGKPGATSGALLSKEEQAAIERYRAEVLKTRRDLREVQHTLNRDIDRLGATVKAINIGLMPIAVAGFAVALAGWRARRRARPVRD